MICITEFQSRILAQKLLHPVCLSGSYDDDIISDTGSYMYDISVYYQKTRT